MAPPARTRIRAEGWRGPIMRAAGSGSVSESHRSTRTNTDSESVGCPAEAGPFGPRLAESIPSGRTRVWACVGFFLVGSARQPPARRAGLSGAVRVYPCLSVAQLEPLLGGETGRLRSTVSSVGSETRSFTGAQEVKSCLDAIARWPPLSLASFSSRSSARRPSATPRPDRHSII